MLLAARARALRRCRAEPLRREFLAPGAVTLRLTIAPTRREPRTGRIALRYRAAMVGPRLPSWSFSLGMVLSLGTACKPDEPDVPKDIVLDVALDRREVDGPDVILVDIAVALDGEPAAGQPVTLTAEGGAAAEVTDLGGGRYRGEVTPDHPSGEVRVRVELLGAEVERTAVVLPLVGPGWGQPERVRGLVNTPGYEDSPEISPDGQWLIVSNTSPIDLVCCLAGCGGAAALDPAGAACNTALGPYAAPERPDFPARRIVSPTQIHDELPSLGLDLPDGQDFQIALPPVAAYGFRRQPDGSYAEPFVIAFEPDGFTVAPFGFTFIGAPQGTSAQVLYGWNDLRVPDEAPENTDNDLWRDDLNLGARNVLGTFTTAPPSLPQLDTPPTPLEGVDRPGMQGNPAVSDDGVWWDSESDLHDLHFAPGDARGGGLGPAVTVALSRPERHEYQPYLFGGRLYFAADFADIRSAARAPGGDPGLASTWSEEQVELACEPLAPRVGAIVSIGEPSVATIDGAPTLFFLYTNRTATGFDMTVGQVRARAP